MIRIKEKDLEAMARAFIHQEQVYTVRAAEAALAWQNALIAASQNPDRAALYRTLSIEFFDYGIQFVGCDGTMLFRTWANYSDIGDLVPDPLYDVLPDKRPDDTVVVMDPDKFVIGFMKTLLTVCSNDAHLFEELTIEVRRVWDEEKPALGDELAEYEMVLRALGQTLTCKLHDGAYPNWRGLNLDLVPIARVDGMIIGTRLFSAVGKLKGVLGIDCSFRSGESAIDVKGTGLSVPFRGFLMPMRRDEAEKRQPKQAEAVDDNEELELEPAGVEA